MSTISMKMTAYGRSYISPLLLRKEKVLISLKDQDLSGPDEIGNQLNGFYLQLQLF